MFLCVSITRSLFFVAITAVCIFVSLGQLSFSSNKDTLLVPSSSDAQKQVTVHSTSREA